MLKRMDIVKLFKANQGRDYVFHECGPLHKGLNMFLDDVDEEFLMTKMICITIRIFVTI